jgi:hypothetical protein
LSEIGESRRRGTLEEEEGGGGSRRGKKNALKMVKDFFLGLEIEILEVSYSAIIYESAIIYF